jgi:CRISPR system Cascade subunit CasD
MQSWGTRSRFTNRDTGLEPSRSGVIGLLCAALGRPRDASLDDFRPLAMAVRVDREGRLMRDYHTAQQVRRADTSKTPQETVLSERFYLADASFLVGLEGDKAFLDKLDAALRQPVWTLSLGRKSFVPTMPVAIGVKEGTLDVVLKNEPGRFLKADPPKALRAVLEVPYGTGEPRQDVPLSFVSQQRHFGVRHVVINTDWPLPPTPTSAME